MRYYFILLLGLVSYRMSAQNAQIIGSVKDTVSYQNMIHSSVNLIRMNDSILIKHMWLRDRSDFKFDHLDSGMYRLQVIRSAYADYDEIISLKMNEIYSVGDIHLIPKTHLLKEVIVKDYRAIRIKGDTTEFLADSFHLHQQATVEELLKKLPGIQVDRSGKITAQGQEVKKVLVDGEEFFGNDPTIATRNLKAESIDKVQVFDKKSEQEVLTGTDDGVKDQTINLMLKDDAKKGSFGKAQIAEGQMENSEKTRMYEDEAMLNTFNAQRKLSLYGASSNTNKTNLSWDDAEKYSGGAGETTIDADGSITTRYTNYDEVYNGQGIPQTWYTGGFFTHKSRDEKLNFTANASHKEVMSNGINNNFTKYIMPDTFYFYDQKNQFHQNNTITKGSVQLKYKLDTATNLNFNLSGSSGTYANYNSYDNQNRNSLDSLINHNVRSNEQNKTSSKINVSFSMNHRFAKKGRSMNVNLALSNSNVESNGYLLSHTWLFNGFGQISGEDSIDQKKLNKQQGIQYTTGISFTEPLSKNLNLSLDYSYAHQFNETENTTLQKDQSSDYNKYIDTLSNHFQYIINTNKTGFSFKYNQKNWRYSLGSAFVFTDLIQNNLITQQITLKPYINFFPNASVSFGKKGSSDYGIRYNGSSRQPSLDQIQPFKDNSNPLNINLGNPNLIQSFTHSISFSFNQYKALKGSGCYMNGSINFTQHDFTSYDKVDVFGRKTHQTVNIEGNYSVYFYGYYYFSIKKWDVNSSIGMNDNYYNQNNFINTLANLNRSFSHSNWINIYQEKEDKYNWSLEYNIHYNLGTSSLRPDVLTHFYTQTYSISGQKYFNPSFSISCKLDANIRQRNSEFDKNYNTVITDIGIEKKFGKEKNINCSFWIKDCFNQNIGFDRTVNSNYINENTYTIIKRYFMIGIEYQFTQGKAKNKE